MTRRASYVLAVSVAVFMLTGCAGGPTATTPSATADSSSATPSAVATSAAAPTLDPGVVEAYRAMSDTLDEDTQPVMEQLLGGAGSEAAALNEQVAASFTAAAAQLRQIDLPADLDDKGTALVDVYEQFAAEYTHAAQDAMYSNASVVGPLQVRHSELDSAIRAELGLPALVTGM
jgi:hypothetical protein